MSDVLITACQRSCEKVMFSVVSFSQSVILSKGAGVPWCIGSRCTGTPLAPVPSGHWTSLYRNSLVPVLTSAVRNLLKCFLIEETYYIKLKFWCKFVGGSISEGMKDLRVNGILNATRGLGNHGDPPLKKCIISDPYTTSVPIDQYAQFLILASNGLWEVFSENEAASLLTQVCAPCIMLCI